MAPEILSGQGQPRRRIGDSRNSIPHAALSQALPGATRSREAIELYRQYAERLIALRDRKNYQAACKYLAKMRALYEKLGESDAWTSYITALREQNRNLRALKEELANAGL